jgi:hypothetical protein
MKAAVCAWIVRLRHGDADKPLSSNVVSSMTWHVFDSGATIGKQGSENGTIVLDEEHADGARITLERDGSTAPWSITCGVSGLMVHTCFFADRATAEAQYEAMKPALQAILSQLNADDLPAQGRLARDFVERFP